MAKNKPFSHGLTADEAKQQVRTAWIAAMQAAVPNILDIEEMDPEGLAEDAAALGDAAAMEFTKRFCPEHLERCLSPDFPGLQESDDDDDEID